MDRNARIQVGTPRRVRVSVSLDVLLGGQTLQSLWGQGGRILWLCLAFSYFLVTRSEEMFASAEGGSHTVRCLQRDNVTCFAEEQVLPPLHWHKATIDRVTKGTKPRTVYTSHGFEHGVSAR